MYYLKIYAIAFIAFFAVDLIWLGVISKNLYSRYLGHLMTPNINWAAAIIFYLLYLVGLVFFVVVPALDKQSLVWAMLAGGLFGLVCYATYDLTNLATLKDWPATITYIDLVWGTFITATTSVITYWIVQRFIT